MNSKTPLLQPGGGRILFKLTDDALVVANTGRPFSLHGLVSVVYGWTSSKKAGPTDWDEADRVFTDEADARQVVDDLFERQRRHFSDRYHQIREASQQSQTAQGYADRAILELLQNAIDAERDKPIGSKGIGFRSILNLTTAPEIHSGSLHVRWSQEIASRALNGATVDPSTVLSFPEWSPVPNEHCGDYITQIILPLNADARSHLQGEWNAITSDPSLIVFLDGVKEVRWESGQPPRVWQRKSDPGFVSVVETASDGKTDSWHWRIHRSASSLAEVAVLESANGTFVRPSREAAGKLRCFFPTEDPNPFSNVLIHAAFPLATDRKRIDLAHVDCAARVADVAEAITLAIAGRREDEALDILAHADVVQLPAGRIESRLCEAVRSAVGGHAVARSRSCPVREQLPYPMWGSPARFESWDKFKGCLSEFGCGGLDELPLLPVGVENEARERTLLWLNPKAPLAKEELCALLWAPVEGGTEPAPSSNPPLFELPDDNSPLPPIPDGIRLHFLSRAFQKTLEERLGARAAGELLHETLGVLPFTLLDVVERAVLPALESGLHPEGTIVFVQALWRRAGKEREKPFDWTDSRRARLIRACRVFCRDGAVRPALEVYAGSDWTNCDYLERIYRSRTDRAFLHAPPQDPGERAEWESFYRWLGVGWSPKVFPLLEETVGGGTRRGLLWNHGRFVGLAKEPPCWSDYCEEAWRERFESSRFVERKPRLKLDWQLDGSGEVLSVPGAFDAVRGNWTSYVRYTHGVCYWSSNVAQDLDNERREADSYLCWMMKHTSWIPAGDELQLHAPCDLFLPGEVAQSRNICGWSHGLKADVPTEMASALGLRRNWSDVGESDWRRWLVSAEKLKPQEKVGDREPIRRLYACLLDYAKPSNGTFPPFVEAKVWWVERLENREHWKLARAAVARGSYLDRPEFEALRLPGVFIFPARLDDKENKAKALFGIPRLSDRLKGEPELSGEQRIVWMSDRIEQRAPFLLSYLGLERSEQRRDEIKAAIEAVRAFEVAHLRVRWLMDGVEVGGGVPAPSFARATEDGWRLYLVTDKLRSDANWGWERLAETLLLACGFRPTEKAANLRDILTCDETRLVEKLTNLGVAPETVEEARKSVVAPSPQPSMEKPLVPPTPLDQPHSAPPILPPSSSGPVAPPPQPSDAPLRRKEPVATRPHPETGLPAQEWLRAKLNSILAPKGWSVSAGEVATDGSESRTDICLTSPSGAEYLVEAKRVEAGKVFWREKQIQSAQSHPGKYFIALLLPSGPESYEVRWVCDPLSSFATLSPDVNWIWRDHAGTGGFAPDWLPKAEPPCRAADSYKAVIKLHNEFVASLPSGIEVILSLIENGVGSAT